MSNLLLIFSGIVLIAALILSIYNNSFLNIFFHYGNKEIKSSTCKMLFTESELSQYNGVNKPELFLAVLGIVYNVTKGADYYGPDKTYSAFVGRDASRSFISGKFDEEQASDDVTGLSNVEIQSLNLRVLFYKKEYGRIGKLIGRYFDENGKATSHNKQIQKLIKDVEAKKHNQHLDNFKFPPCNVEWNAEIERTRVWCTKRSGGFKRSWIGYPRHLFEPGSKLHRCACIKDENLELWNVEEYYGCDPSFDSCYVTV